MIYISNGNLLSKSDISVVGIIFERQFFETFFFKKGNQWETWYILSLIFGDVIFSSNWKLFLNILSTTLQVILFFCVDILLQKTRMALFVLARYGSIQKIYWAEVVRGLLCSSEFFLYCVVSANTA